MKFVALIVFSGYLVLDLFSNTPTATPAQETGLVETGGSTTLPACWNNSHPVITNFKIARIQKVISFSAEKSLYDRPDWKLAFENAAMAWTRVGLQTRTGITFRLTGSVIVPEIQTIPQINAAMATYGDVVLNTMTSNIAGAEGYQVFSTFEFGPPNQNKVEIRASATVIQQNAGWMVDQANDNFPDLQSAIVHEFGHWLGLQDIGRPVRRNPSEYFACFDRTTMWWIIPSGAPRRAPLAADIDAITKIYL